MLSYDPAAAPGPLGWKGAWGCGEGNERPAAGWGEQADWGAQTLSWL